ncbi:MAG: sensor histidine kinase [Acidimicrobiales bacterium]
MTATTQPRSFCEATLGPLALPGVAAAVGALGGSVAVALASTRHGANGVFHSGSRAVDVLGGLLLVLSTTPLAASRRAPVAVFSFTTAAATVAAALGYPIGFPVGPTVALYFLAASRSEERPWSRAMTTTVVGLLVAYLGARATALSRFPGLELSHTSLAWAAAWFAGDRVRLRHKQIAELRERAVHAERDAERERLLAVAEERARIARDLHDSAGSAVNVIAVRAGAARLRHTSEPHRSLAALEAIEELARQTAEEIDHIVGALREGGARQDEVESPPGLASLADLVARQAASGLDVTVDTAGSPQRLGGTADQAAYRILQEALTNAARHGAGGARVELRYGDAAVDLLVTNPVAVGGVDRSGGGHGIVGMRERAALLGGALSAERAKGTFSVRASLPYGTRL